MHVLEGNTAKPPKIAVVIVNYRTPELAIGALRSVAAVRVAHPGLSAVLVDNASGDRSQALFNDAASSPEFSEWLTVLPQMLNGGFGWGNNQAVIYLAGATLKPDLVLFLNPDAELQSGAMLSLSATLAKHPECGLVGACLLNEAGVPGTFAFRNPTIGREFLRGSRAGRFSRLMGIAPMVIDNAGEADWVTGAAFMMRWCVIEQIGLFDDGYFLYFEEIELMNRVRAGGWTIRYAPDAHVLHRAGSSTGVDWDLGLLPHYWHRSRRRYFVQALGTRNADRADRAYLWGTRLAGLRHRPAPDTAENLRRMREAAALPLAPRNVAQTADQPQQPPAWMEIA